MTFDPFEMNPPDSTILRVHTRALIGAEPRESIMILKFLSLCLLALLFGNSATAQQSCTDCHTKSPTCPAMAKPKVKDTIKVFATKNGEELVVDVHESSGAKKSATARWVAETDHPRGKVIDLSAVMPQERPHGKKKGQGAIDIASLLGKAGGKATVVYETVEIDDEGNVISKIRKQGGEEALDLTDLARLLRDQPVPAGQDGPIVVFGRTGVDSEVEGDKACCGCCKKTATKKHEGMHIEVFINGEKVHSSSHGGTGDTPSPHHHGKKHTHTKKQIVVRGADAIPTVSSLFRTKPSPTTKPQGKMSKRVVVLEAEDAAKKQAKRAPRRQQDQAKKAPKQPKRAPRRQPGKQAKGKKQTADKEAAEIRKLRAELKRLQRDLEKLEKSLGKKTRKLLD